MSKTVTMKDVIENPEQARHVVEQQARQMARFHVIRAKRELAQVRVVERKTEKA